MKVLTVVGVLLAHACSLIAQSKPPVLMSGLGQHHHTISTKNAEAQRFFDQGLTLVFAFNHEEAARSFRRASELDPQSAMVFWGIALALGLCINLDVDPPHERAAYEAVQKALTLAPSASEKEREYIHALSTRYSSDPKVDLRKRDAEYAAAMRELSKRYPDDLDAATLYAESLMDLHPWKLWSLDGARACALNDPHPERGFPSAGHSQAPTPDVAMPLWRGCSSDWHRYGWSRGAILTPTLQLFLRCLRSDDVASGTFVQVGTTYQQVGAETFRLPYRRLDLRTDKD